MDNHDTILISCTDQETRAVLRAALGERFNILEARSIRQTAFLMHQNRNCIAALVIYLDQDALHGKITPVEPAMEELLRSVPIILVAQDPDNETLVRGFSYGAADVIPANYDPYAMLRRIENIVDLHLHKQHLANMVAEQAMALRRSNETVVDALSSIIEYRSIESGQHVLRIRHFTKILLEELAKYCPEYQLTETDISQISSASALHDIGKIAIPDSILMKPGRLTDEERQIMQTHSATGSEIIKTLDNIGDSTYMRYAYNICRYHHERWDGKGYPDGLSGDDIPICAQVVGLADCYDALTSKRVYKDAFSFSKATNMILQGECGVFSPRLLDCFKHVISAYERLAQDYADGLSPKQESLDLTIASPTPQDSISQLDRIRAKYYAMVHYVNGFLMEIDLKREIFHLIYNPYPDLLPLDQVSSLADVWNLFLTQIVGSCDRDQMERFIHHDIPEFVDQDLRRRTVYFRFRTPGHPNGERFEVSLLRIHSPDSANRSLAILCRQASGDYAEESHEDTHVQTISEHTLLCMNDGEFTLVDLEGNINMLAGYTSEEIKNELNNKLINLILPEDREKFRSSLSAQLKAGIMAQAEFRCRRKDGKIIWVRDTSRLVISPGGQEYLDVYLLDITDLKQEADDLNKKLEKYEIILSQTENVLFEWDVGTDRVSVSKTWEKLFGVEPSGASVREILENGSYFHPDDLPLLVDAITSLERRSGYEIVEVRISNTNGRYTWYRLRANAIKDKANNLQKIVGIIINIDAEKQAQRSLLDRANRDSLTKLLNKNAVRTQAEEYLSRFPHGVDCAMLIIDLNNFKQVNDRYGHLFGDAVLAQAAKEIKDLFRPQDIIGRIGGDEFIVMVRGTADRQLLESRCQRLLNILATTFRNQKQKLPLGCSIGIALCPQHGTTYYDLFNHADQALYRSKARGKECYTFFDGADILHTSVQDRPTTVNTRIDSDEEPGLSSENIIRYSFQQLYSAQDENKAIGEILALIGKRMNVSRVYVFENSDDNRFCSNTYEWCNEGIPPEIQNLQNISYERDIPGYADNFNEQGIFYCPDITVLPQKTRDIVEPQGIKSMLHCAIRERGVFRGYIGFDECVEQRLWTKEQIGTLTFLSEMLSVFLLKKRQQERDQMQAENMQTILDNQNAWIYIIDPDDCRIRYLNAKTRQLAPKANTGMYCYKALMDLDSRCPGCPAMDIHKRKNNVCDMHNEKFDLHLRAEATQIRWEGKESCLLICREADR